MRLHVVKLPKNMGMPGSPRNIGIQSARGKYIAFLDSDDLFTPTALEELTTLAEEYQADVVHMDHFFKLWGGKGKSVDDPAFTDMAEITNPSNFIKVRSPRYTPNKPTFETNDLAERVKKFIAGGYAGEPYTSFYRRDFLLINQITFLDIKIFEDQIFVFQTMCLAEKLLRVPNVNYILRPREGSVVHERLDVKDELHKSLRIYIDGFNELIRIMGDIKFFVERPDYRYVVLNWYIQSKLYRLEKIYARIHPAAFNHFVEREFSGDDTAFAVYLFNTVNFQRLQIIQLRQELAKFHKQ